MAKITFYGQSCFLIEHNGINILLDPFISGNDLTKDIDINTIPADYILLSHGHQDHVLDAESIAKRTSAKIISNFEIVNWYGEKGLKNTHPLNHGGGYDFEFGRVKMVQAVHTSSMPDGSYGGQPAGFVVTLKDGPTFYYSGDTALTYDMKLIGEECAIDFAMLCIGDNFTMGIDDAIRAAEFVGTHKIIGMHFDTFPPIEIDHDQSRSKFSNAGRDLILLDIGQSIDL